MATATGNLQIENFELIGIGGFISPPQTTVNENNLIANQNNRRALEQYDYGTEVESCETFSCVVEGNFNPLNDEKPEEPASTPGLQPEILNPAIEIQKELRAQTNAVIRQKSRKPSVPKAEPKPKIKPGRQRALQNREKKKRINKRKHLNIGGRG